MSFQEKSTWIYCGLTGVVSAVYFVNVLGQARNTAVTEIAYAWQMLIAIGVAVALSVAAHVVVATTSPSEADKSDERDTAIHRYGEYLGSFALAIGVLVPLGLAIAQFEHFWIANAIYLAFVLQALTSSTVKLVAYRRGF